jgi:predicted nucleotidyltransferase
VIALSEVKTALETSRARIAASYGVDLYGIVGSFARGDQTDTSDVDVAARLCGRLTLFQLAALSDELSRAVGREVDIVFPDDLPDYKRSIMLQHFVPL